MFSLKTVTYQFTISHFICIQPIPSTACHTETALSSHQTNMTLVSAEGGKEGRVKPLGFLIWGKELELEALPSTHSPVTAVELSEELIDFTI